MKSFKKYLYQMMLLSICFCFITNITAQKKPTLFKVIAFYTAKSDLAHISFVHEANKWFPQMAGLYNFSYDSTNDWSNLNEAFLSDYQVVIFLDTRPEKATQREAFKKYMDNGGAFIGFHFAGFTLKNSD
ncbi:MAG TPA: ThuA domain-containing protein, partial [Chitinophagaceae bacterium]